MTLPRTLALALALMLPAASCGTEELPGPALPPPLAVVVKEVLPGTLLPGSTLLIRGQGFVSSASHTLRLKGALAKAGGGTPAAPVDHSLTLTPESGERARVLVGRTSFDALGGEGAFTGQAVVTSANSGGSVSSAPLEVSLTLAQGLTPTISAAGSSLVYLNSRVPVVGSGFLLGGKEGTSEAQITGCFLPAGSSGACPSGGKAVDVRLPLKPEKEGRRDRAYFEFSPEVAGVKAGNLTGALVVRNVHGSESGLSAPVQVSAKRDLSMYLDLTMIQSLGQSAVSLGQYLDIKGLGFVGGDKGSTTVTFQGTFTAAGSTAVQAGFTLVASCQDGYLARYVLEEKQGIGQVVDLRHKQGTLSGKWTPTVYWGSDSSVGQPAQLSLQISGVKQVVWVQYTAGWSDSLRLLGLGAADMAIRARIRKVLERDYKGINVEFREVEPTDFKLYSKLDLGGKDPNGLSLMGYDNTPGKDVENKRLHDWVGGVNALTQADGFPGYGGVFLESLLGFSLHPPAGVMASPIKTDLFDRVFDAFRKDRGGTELSAAEASAAQPLSSGAGCPAGPGDRVKQAQCAVFVLGNTIGSTASHEFGHSLGLADPYGPATTYHNPGDQPNRLMDTGDSRSFEERAELNGKGPAVFCGDEYQYLQAILPLTPPVTDPVAKRPGCY